MRRLFAVLACLTFDIRLNKFYCYF